LKPKFFAFFLRRLDIRIIPATTRISRIRATTRRYGHNPEPEPVVVELLAREVDTIDAALVLLAVDDEVVTDLSVTEPDDTVAVAAVLDMELDRAEVVEVCLDEAEVVEVEDKCR
jgi:hypothetical protein